MQVCMRRIGEPVAGVGLQGCKLPCHSGEVTGKVPRYVLRVLRSHSSTSLSACATRTSFLPNLLQQLPPRISDSEHRAVNVIRRSLPFFPQVLSLLLALQHIVVD